MCTVPLPRKAVALPRALQSFAKFAASRASIKSDSNGDFFTAAEPPELRSRSRSSGEPALSVAKGRSKDSLPGNPDGRRRVRRGKHLGGPSTVLRRSALRAPTPSAAQDDNPHFFFGPFGDGFFACRAWPRVTLM